MTAICGDGPNFVVTIAFKGGVCLLPSWPVSHRLVRLISYKGSEIANSIHTGGQ
jgi:hypothetical protein